MTMTRKAVLAQGALMAFLAPILAQDAKVDLGPALDGVTSENFAERKPKIVEAVTAATKDKLATDAKLDALPSLLDAIEGVATPEEKTVTAEPGITKQAMDAAISDATAKATKDGASAASKLAQDIRKAERHVSKLVGELSPDLAFDSASDVYRAGLKSIGVETKDIHESALPALLEAHASKKEPTHLPAMDAASTDGFAKRFPGAARLSA